MKQLNIPIISTNLKRQDPSIFNNKVTLHDANKDQSNKLMNILVFHDKARPRAKKGKKIKRKRKKLVKVKMLSVKLGN